MSTIVWMIIVLILVTGWIVTVLISQRKEKKLMNRLRDMLDQAMNGDFSVKSIDETKFSSLENQLARFIADCGTTVEDLEAQKKLIKELVTDISHQTTTPIANIQLYNQLLSEELELDSDHAVSGVQKTEAIAEQARKLDFLIQSLVKMSRIETGMIQIHSDVIPVQKIFTNMYQQFQLKAEAKEITLRFEPTDLSVCCDEKWTIEALANLVDNAIKYTDVGGKVTVLAQEYPTFLRINICDTGIGIAEEEQCQIYERFYRSPRVSKCPGIGIGLALTRDIIQLQHGYLKLESHIGKGSTFSVFLPNLTKL